MTDYRKPKNEDVEALVALELKVWGEEMFANYEKWAARIKTFPEGIRLAWKDDVLVGVVAAHIVDWQYPGGYLPTWAEITGNGLMSNHNSNGNFLYGIDLGVLPGMYRVANSLVAFTVKLQQDLCLPYGGLGCRIPSLAQYVKDNKINTITNKLVEQVADNDVHVDFWIKNGFQKVAAREGYFPEDQESLGWGLILKTNASLKF